MANLLEDVLLAEGKLILKTCLTETIAYSKYVNYNIGLDQLKMDPDLIKSQVDGHSILHLICLEERKLKLVLDYFAKFKPEYLSLIVAHNHNGNSPLSIATKNRNMNTTSMLLEYLSNIANESYSQNLFKLFPDLIEMNLKSFHLYLETCLFKTAQMENTSYLNLKKRKEEITFLSNSCILDQSFYEEYTSKDVKEENFNRKLSALEQEKKRYNEGIREIQKKLSNRNNDHHFSD